MAVRLHSPRHIDTRNLGSISGIGNFRVNVRRPVYNYGEVWDFWKSWYEPKTCENECYPVDTDYCGTSCWLGGNCPTILAEETDCLGDTRYQNNVFVLFTPEATYNCPGSLDLFDDPVIGVRVQYKTTYYKRFARHYKEVCRVCYPYNGYNPPPDCDEEPDKCVCGTGPWEVAQYLVTETHYRELTVYRDLTPSQAEALWQEMSQGVAGPLSLGANSEFIVAAGEISLDMSGPRSYTRQGMSHWLYGRACDPSDWLTEVDYYEYLGPASYGVDRSTIFVQVNSGDGRGWRNTYIWTGNSMGNMTYNHYWYQAHVKQLP